MTLTLTAEAKELIEKFLNTGEYGTVDEVLLAALKALDDVEACALDEETLAAIDRAEDQLEQGECIPWEDVRERVRDRFLGKEVERQLLEGLNSGPGRRADDEYWAEKERKLRDRNQGEQP